MPKIVEEGWTARKVERYFAEHKKSSSAKAVKRRMYIKEENRLAEYYGAREVKIVGKSLTFKCKNEAELLKLIEKLG